VTYKDFESYCKNFCGELWPLINCTDYNRCRKTFTDSRRGMVPLDEVIETLEVIDQSYLSRGAFIRHSAIFEVIDIIEKKYGVK